MKPNVVQALRPYHDEIIKINRPIRVCFITLMVCIAFLIGGFYTMINGLSMDGNSGHLVFLIGVILLGIAAGTAIVAGGSMFYFYHRKIYPSFMEEDEEIITALYNCYFRESGLLFEKYWINYFDDSYEIVLDFKSQNAHYKYFVRNKMNGAVVSTGGVVPEAAVQKTSYELWRTANDDFSDHDELLLKINRNQLRHEKNQFNFEMISQNAAQTLKSYEENLVEIATATANECDYEVYQNKVIAKSFGINSFTSERDMIFNFNFHGYSFANVARRVCMRVKKDSMPLLGLMNQIELLLKK